MLQGMTWASPPAFLMPSATSLQASSLRLETTTLAPSFASSSAEERPMPRLEPVMTATLPVRSNGVFFTGVSFLATQRSPDGAKRNPGAASPAFPDCASLHPGYKMPSLRGAQATKQSMLRFRVAGLLRFARNDGMRVFAGACPGNDERS